MAGVYAGMGMLSASSCEAASRLLGSTTIRGAAVAATTGRMAGVTGATTEKAEAEAAATTRRRERNIDLFFLNYLWLPRGCHPP